MRHCESAIVGLIVFLALLAARHHDAPQALIDATTSKVDVDYQRCVTVPNGPIQCPDGYTAQPFGRQKDDA